MPFTEAEGIPQLGQRVQNTFTGELGTVTGLIASTQAVRHAGAVEVTQVGPLVTVTWDGDAEGPRYLQLDEYHRWVREI
jgi:hypothetical protein